MKTISRITIDSITEALALEYAQLAMLERMNDTEGERYEEILSHAEENEKLDLIINEIDHLLAHEDNCIDLKEIDEAAAILIEYAGTEVPQRISKDTQNVAGEKTPCCTSASNADHN